MLKEERQQLILDRLYEYGNVTVNKLSDEFRVSKDSIRRDLTELEEQGILRRVFGGAVPFKMLAADIDKRMNVEKDRKVSNYNICKIDSVSRIICEYPVIREIQNRYKEKIY